MAAGVPPPPLNSPSGSYYWLEWYTNLTNFLNGTNIPWSNLNFSGSDIFDLQNRHHNSLQSIQGGNAGADKPGTGNAWHMSGRGYVDAGGTGTGFPGWTTSHTGTGTYTIVHNLGSSAPNISAVATSATTGVFVNWIDCSSTTQVVVRLINTSGSLTDGAFSLIINT